MWRVTYLYVATTASILCRCRISHVMIAYSTTLLMSSLRHIAQNRTTLRFRDQANLRSGAAILVHGRSPQKRMYDATADTGLSKFPFLRDECESSSWSQNARLRSSLSAGAHLFRPIERSGMILLHHHVIVSRPGPQPLSLLHTISAGATLGGLGRL